MREVAAVQARNGRPYMEDFVHVEQPFAGQEDALYVGVFDGHGGDAVSRRAAAEVHAILAAQLGPGLPLDVALHGTFRTFDEAVADESCGSTAVIAVIRGRELTVANAGDSHILLVSRGAGVRLTMDHRLETEGERRRVVAAGAEIWGPYACLPGGQGLMCTRSLGDRAFREIGIIAEPDVTSRGLAADDSWLVAASDGVWDGVEDKVVAGLAERATTAQQAADRIRDAAIDSNSDNVTVVAVRL